MAIAVLEQPLISARLRPARNSSRLVPAQSRWRQPRPFARRGERRFPFLLLLLRLGFWFLIYDRGCGSMVSAHTVTLLHDGLRDFISQQLAIIPVARFATFRSVAQITAFHQ